MIARMRWAAVVVVVVVVASACGGDHFGTYFLADGRKASITFDHAEFYFGDGLDGTFASPAGPAKNGDVYQRLFNAADVAVPTDHGAALATYYLAPDGDTNVGSYVLVLARDAQNAIVGVGEAADFPLAGAGEVVEVMVPLQAPGQSVQQWGTDPACVTWARADHGPVAFVRDNDRDCDGAIAQNDCNDLLYCRAGDPTCSNTPMLCNTPTCAIGCMSQGTCVPSLCLSDLVCNPPGACAALGSISDTLKCVVAQGAATHLDVRVPTAAQTAHPDQPCVHSFTVPLPDGMQCANPTIVFTEPFADGYVFQVDEAGTSCKFDLNMPSNQPPFVGDHHLLVAIDPATGTSPRHTFLIGFNPLQGASCTSMVSTENQLSIESCQ
jgi:hypothetical protein